MCEKCNGKVTPPVKAEEKPVEKPKPKTIRESILLDYDNAIESIGKYIVSGKQHVEAMKAEMVKVEEAMKEAEAVLNDKVKSREYIAKRLK